MDLIGEIMRRKTNKLLLWSISIAIFGCLIAVISITYPHDIVKEGDSIITAEYNSGFGNDQAEFVDISDKTDEIVAILAKYKERTVFFTSNGYNLGNVEFRIILNTAQGAKEILLGSDNYSYISFGSFKHIIIDAEELSGELRQLISTSEIDTDYTIPSEELYMNIYNKTIRYEDAPLYLAFQNDVIRKINDSANLNVTWNDVTVFIRDNPYKEMYPYSIFVPTDLGYNVVMEAAVSSFSDNGIISYNLLWSNVYRVYGSYSLGDELISVNNNKSINKTQLTDEMAKIDEYSDYAINYAGLRLDEKMLFVPLHKEDEVVAAQIAIGDDFSYCLLSALPINTKELTTYEFIVKNNCFGFTPIELMEYELLDQLNPRTAILDYYGNEDVIDDATIYSEFIPTTYIRIKYNDTDVIFHLVDMQTDTEINVSDITDEAMCERLTWKPTTR